MAKQQSFNFVPDIVGWYQPHIAVNWTGEILDPRTGELVKEPSMTKQSFKEECDINNIVRRFEATGVVDHINQAHAQGLFTDLPDALDLQAGLNMIKQAEGAFMALPASLRARFENDPVQFVDFMDNPANQEEMIKLGLAKDTRPPSTPPVEPAKASESPK